MTAANLAKAITLPSTQRSGRILPATSHAVELFSARSAKPSQITVTHPSVERRNAEPHAATGRRRGLREQWQSIRALPGAAVRRRRKWRCRTPTRKTALRRSATKVRFHLVGVDNQADARTGTGCCGGVTVSIQHGWSRSPETIASSPSWC
jgi:hypothetical protein